MTGGKSRLTVPDWLSAPAAAEWRRMVDAGVIVQAQQASVMASYCQHYARWRQAEEELERNGCEIVIRDDKGVVKGVIVSPWFAVSNRSFDRMLKAAGVLGLGRVASVGGERRPVAPADDRPSWFADVIV